MKLTRKKSLLLLAATALICSRGFFALVDDPEGPNLLIVSVLAIVIYSLSLVPHLPKLNRITRKGVLISICIQSISTTGLFIILENFCI